VRGDWGPPPVERCLASAFAKPTARQVRAAVSRGKCEALLRGIYALSCVPVRSHTKTTSRPGHRPLVTNGLAPVASQAWRRRNRITLRGGDWAKSGLPDVASGLARRTPGVSNDGAESGVSDDWAKSGVFWRNSPLNMHGNVYLRLSSSCPRKLGRTASNLR
jgi:hypothetical protein